LPGSLSQLPVSLSSFGYEVRSGLERYRHEGAHRGEGVLLQYTLDGCGALRYGSREFPVPAGHLMLLHWPHDHCYHLPPGGRWEQIYGIVGGASARRLLIQVERELGPVIPLGHAHAVAQQWMSMILAGLRGELADPLQASGRMYAMVLALIAHARSCQASQPRADAVVEAKRFAVEHLGDNIGVDDLARAAGMSRFHFSRLFRRVCGDTPAAWLQEQRLQLAMNLLPDGDLTLENVARRCGFANANYFGKVFRKAFGLSPGIFRSRP
jgi:AraC-like DNA-binding protein